MIIYLTDKLPKQYTVWDNRPHLVYQYSEEIIYKGQLVKGDWHINTDHRQPIIIVLFLFKNEIKTYPDHYFATRFNEDFSLEMLAENADNSLVEYARKVAKFYKDRL